MHVVAKYTKTMLFLCFAVVVLQLARGWTLTGRQVTYPQSIQQQRGISSCDAPNPLVLKMSIGIVAKESYAYDTHVALPAPLLKIVDVDVKRNSFIYEVTLERDLGVEFVWDIDTVNKLSSGGSSSRECTQIGEVIVPPFSFLPCIHILASSLCVIVGYSRCRQAATPANRVSGQETS